jgi:hypothetical protein
MQSCRRCENGSEIVDHFENKHCTETPWAQRYHYKQHDGGTVACGEKDNPTRVMLRTCNKSYPTIDFELPRQRYDLDKIEQMLKLAYEAGRIANKREVAAMMKELIAL